jgi:cytochrome P450
MTAAYDVAVPGTGGPATIDELPYIDLESEQFGRTPYQILDDTRNRTWAARTHMGIMILSHTAAQELYADTRLRQPGIETFKLQGIYQGVAYDWWANHMLHLEGTEHKRMRRLVSGAFSAKAVNAYLEQMYGQVDELSRSLPADQPFDFVERYAHPLPRGVVGSLLGIPADEIHQFNKWASDITLVGPARLKENLPLIENGITCMYDRVRELIEQRLAGDGLGTDLMSNLLRAQEGGERLTVAEVQSLVVLIFIGGLDTTSFQLSGMMATFLDRPRLWRRLAAQPEAAHRVAEEMLRYQPAIIENYRFAPVDIDYRGFPIPANTYISISTGAANWDPACAVNGDQFDLDRPPSPHITFGKGAHFCVGAALARAELEATLRTLPALMPTIRWEGTPRYRAPRSTTGPEYVPMSFSRESGSAT